MKYFEKKVTEKVQEKWCLSWNWQNEDKTIFCCFSNARSILEPMLYNRNLTKLVEGNLVKATNQCRLEIMKKLIKP